MPTLNLGRVGFVNKGIWLISTAYKINDTVTYLGGTYACLIANTGQVPILGGTIYWQEWVSEDTVHRSGVETITGLKTFSLSPIIPDATTAFQPLTFGQFRAKLASDINSATAKTTPIDADKFGIWDSVSGLLNSVSLLNLKATIFTSPTFTDTPTAPNFSYKPTPVTVTSWSYVTTTITLNVASHTFVAGDYIEVGGLTATTNIPNGVHLVTSVTATTIVFTYALTPTGTAGVSSATVKGYMTTNERTNGIGEGQTWQDVTASRVTGTTYTNSTGKPIMVSVAVNTTSSITVGSSVIASVTSGQNQMIAIVPQNTSYTSTGGFITWLELR